MPRPPKEGIDYFPLDCALDDKFRLIEAEFGLTGFAVIVKLLQMIYGGNGYYREWNDEVALLFAKDVGLGGNAVSEIVRASIKRGVFDSGIFEKYGVLTSSGIQKRYLEAVRRRKNLELINQYLLVKVAQVFENVNINVVYVDINCKNVRNNPQSKVKESKGKKSKVFIAPTLDDIIAYCKERNNNIDPKRFFDYFSASGWIDSKGNPVRNWKQKIITWEGHNAKDNAAPISGANKSSPSRGNVL